MTVQIYFEMLCEIPADELKYAVDTCIKQPGRVFPPTVGEINAAWLDKFDGIYHAPRPELPMPPMTDEERRIIYGDSDD